MKVFTCCGPKNFVALAMAFNRGHAAKLLGKELEARGIELTKEYVISELDPEENPKGRVMLLTGGQDGTDE